MKMVHAFWLMAVALAFLSIESFVPLPSAIARLAELALVAAALGASLSKALSIKHRAVLFIIGLALALPPMLTWVLAAAGKSLVGADIWALPLMLRAGLIGFGFIVFGFEATPKLWPRLIIAAVGFAWSVFVTRGMRVALNAQDIVFVFGGVAIAGVSLWLSNYLKRTEDANGPKA